MRRSRAGLAAVALAIAVCVGVAHAAPTRTTTQQFVYRDENRDGRADNRGTYRVTAERLSPRRFRVSATADFRLRVGTPNAAISAKCIRQRQTDSCPRVESDSISVPAGARRVFTRRLIVVGSEPAACIRSDFRDLSRSPRLILATSGPLCVPFR